MPSMTSPSMRILKTSLVITLIHINCWLYVWGMGFLDKQDLERVWQEQVVNRCLPPQLKGQKSERRSTTSELNDSQKVLQRN